MNNNNSIFIIDDKFSEFSQKDANKDFIPLKKMSTAAIGRTYIKSKNITIAKITRAKEK